MIYWGHSMAEDLREFWLLLGPPAQVVRNVHPIAWCSGTCVVHNPSSHGMRDLPLRFNDTYRAFVRVCEHGAEHHDPDEHDYWLTKYSLALGRRGNKVQLALAMEKLANFSCPTCSCGCCLGK